MKNKILLIQRQRHVVTLVLNRPAKKNSLSPELVDLLLQTLVDLGADDMLRVLIIRGAGDQAFCSGYDIGSLPTGSGRQGRELMAALNPVESLFQALVKAPFAVIAMLNGFAFGAGCELAVCCDIRIGAEDIKMGMPPAKLGLVYPWRGLQRFVQVLGLRTTREMFFTGRSYSGPRLMQMGLVDYLVPAARLETFTAELAGEIAANAPLAVRGTKKILNLLGQAPLLDEKLLTEAEAVTAAAFRSEDLLEGQAAFLEKRKPCFKGR